MCGVLFSWQNEQHDEFCMYAFVFVCVCVFDDDNAADDAMTMMKSALVYVLSAGELLFCTCGTNAVYVRVCLCVCAAMCEAGLRFAQECVDVCSVVCMMSLCLCGVLLCTQTMCPLLAPL